MSDFTDNLVTLIDANWETDNAAKPGIIGNLRSYPQVDLGNNDTCLVYETGREIKKYNIFFTHKNLTATARIELRAASSDRMKDMRTELVRVIEEQRLSPFAGWSLIYIDNDENTDWKYVNIFSRTITLRIRKFAQIMETAAG